MSKQKEKGKKSKNVDGEKGQNVAHITELY